MNPEVIAFIKEWASWHIVKAANREMHTIVSSAWIFKKQGFYF